MQDHHIACLPSDVQSIRDALHGIRCKQRPGLAVGNTGNNDGDAAVGNTDNNDSDAEELDVGVELERLSLLRTDSSLDISVN